jgi:hypothetical protein
MESSGFIVYGLIDPRTGQLRYVGKSTRGLRRATEHLQPGRLGGDRTHKAKWIRSLRKLGLKYEVEVLEKCGSLPALDEAERHFIGYFRAVGVDLTNHTDGGEGTSGWVPSLEFRANISRALKGGTKPPRSEEHKRRLSESLQGRAVWNKGTPSTARGLPRSAEVRERISRAKGGRPVVVQGTQFPSVRAAARALGVNPGNLWKSLQAEAT